MLKHPNPEIQILVEMLEQQRDSAMAQAAALHRENQELKAEIDKLKPQENAGLTD